MKFLNKKFLTLIKMCEEITKGMFTYWISHCDSMKFTLHLSCDWFPRSTNQIHLSKYDHLTVVF